MNKKTVNKSLILITLMLTILQISNVSAHVKNEQFLVSGASATDIWEIECSGGSQRLVMMVLDTWPGASNVAVQVYKDGKAENTVDALGADPTFSPLISVEAGDGTYIVLVNHTKGGINRYDLDFHCEKTVNGAVIHTDTTTPDDNDIIQDQ